MRTLYDAQQLLEKYGVLVHVGKRIWDIELMALEFDRVYQAGLLDKKTYLLAKMVLTHEYELELHSGK
ncbi:MAG: YqgQ family protein [Lactobacillus sp.]